MFRFPVDTANNKTNHCVTPSDISSLLEFFTAAWMLLSLKTCTLWREWRTSTWDGVKADQQQILGKWLTDHPAPNIWRTCSTFTWQWNMHVQFACVEQLWYFLSPCQWMYSWWDTIVFYKPEGGGLDKQWCKPQGSQLEPLTLTQDHLLCCQFVCSLHTYTLI